MIRVEPGDYNKPEALISFFNVQHKTLIFILKGTITETEQKRGECSVNVSN